MNNNNKAKGSVYVPKNRNSSAGKRAIANNNNNNNKKAPSKVLMPLIQATNSRVQKLERSNARITANPEKGKVNVSMEKSKVDGYLEQFLLPENAKKVLPFGTGGQNVGCFTGPAMSLDLQNGLGTGQNTLRSIVAVTSNPEAPLLSATNTGVGTVLNKGDWGTLESRCENVYIGKATDIGGNVWLGGNSALIGMALQPGPKMSVNINFDGDTITRAAYYDITTTFGGNRTVGLQALAGANGGVLHLFKADGTHHLTQNYGNDETTVVWPVAGAYRMVLVQKGSMDLGFKVINQSTDDQYFGLTLTGVGALVPLVSQTYKNVAASEGTQCRVVSSAVCLTYAPDHQYGGGSMVSAVLEPEQPGDISSWESYLYSRRRSYMDVAFKGNYNVCLPTARSLAFENTKRLNYFWPDAPRIGLSVVQYKPANAGVNVDTLNMQVKGQVWYDFSTSDNSRSSTSYLDQDELCQRIFTGLSLLYRPSENPTHRDYAKYFQTAWHWLNGGSDEATALRRAAAALGKGAVKAIPGLLAML